jgi:D-alanyl-D-alanine carboxypeptidase
MSRLARALISFALLTGILSCARDTRPYETRVQEALREGLQEFNVKGASVAVIMPDGRIYKIVAGFSHDSIAIQPDMLFAIGSITKNVVAALVLQLAEEGILRLNDPISRWLPKYLYVDSTITIRQLLNHTSGLYMFWDNQKLWDDLKQHRDSVFSPEAVLSYIRDPYFSPGKEFRYSNTNYLLLAMICTHATNSTLSAEFRRRFWGPLKIDDAWLSLEEHIPQDLAHVWGDNFENDGSVRDLTFLPRTSHESITYGSSGLFMTAEGLARWSDALFGGEVLAGTSLDEMLKFGKGGYGLGVGSFRSALAGGVQAVGHMGGNIGTTASMVYSRTYGVSVVVMVNAYHLKCIGELTEKVGEITLDYLESEKRQKQREEAQ